MEPEVEPEVESEVEPDVKPEVEPRVKAEFRPQVGLQPFCTKSRFGKKKFLHHHHYLQISFKKVEKIWLIIRLGQIDNKYLRQV